MSAYHPVEGDPDDDRRVGDAPDAARRVCIENRDVAHQAEGVLDDEARRVEEMADDVLLEIYIAEYNACNDAMGGAR